MGYPDYYISVLHCMNEQWNHYLSNIFVEREDCINTCVPLYNASINGDWNAAVVILSARKELVRHSITENCETALHVATSAQNTKFVEAIVGLTENEDLELQNKSGNTTLYLAAAAGNTKFDRSWYELF